MAPTMIRNATAETLLLSSIRAWTLGRGHPASAEAAIHALFARHGCTDAAALLGGFLWAVSHGARRPLVLNCLCQAEISEDERLLLDVLALHAAGCSLGALLHLRTVLRPLAALAANDSAARLAHVLATAGLQPSGAPLRWQSVATTGAPHGMLLN